MGVAGCFAPSAQSFPGKPAAAEDEKRRGTVVVPGSFENVVNFIRDDLSFTAADAGGRPCRGFRVPEPWLKLEDGAGREY